MSFNIAVTVAAFLIAAVVLLLLVKVIRDDYRQRFENIYDDEFKKKFFKREK